MTNMLAQNIHMTDVKNESFGPHRIRSDIEDRDDPDPRDSWQCGRERYQACMMIHLNPDYAP